MQKLKVLLCHFFVLCLAAPIALAAEPVRQASLEHINGTVEVRIKGSDWVLAGSAVVLNEMDEIRTHAASSAVVVLDANGSTGSLELRENSHLRLSTMHWLETSGDKVTYLDLAKGRVLAKVEKLKGESKFEVRTPNASAGVRGTIFEVSVDEQTGNLGGTTSF